MATTAYHPGTERSGRFLHRNRARTVRQPRLRTRSVTLELAGVIALLVAAWGALLPYLAPTFGFSADGTSSWTWNLPHALLGLIPGAVGVIVGLSLITPKRVTVARSRISLSSTAVLAMASGAWFAIGPLAWRVLYGGTSYFKAATPLGDLEHWIGYALGPGLVLAMCGAFAMGWAARHDRPLGATEVVPPVVTSATPPPAPTATTATEPTTA